jgi:branched-chain amino acid transport system ATP-binding protein
MLFVEGLSARYGKATVLQSVDIKVPTGTAVALLGSNGAGKTTTLKAISGLVDHQARCMTLGDDDLLPLAAHHRAERGVCLIPEGRGIFPQLTVAENISLFAGLPVRSLDKVLPTVDHYFPALRPKLGLPAGGLSGGQQQMLALTRALVDERAVVMADELSHGLAPKIVDEVYETIAQMRSDGRSLLIVEQYVDRVVKVVDYIYVLRKGRVVDVGEAGQWTAAELFSRYHGQEDGQ